jgi:hypothetical protein
MAKINVLAFVRGLLTPNWPEGADSPICINNRGDIAVAQALPPAAELVRLGGSYFCLDSAVAPVAALPTTTAHLSLWNGEAPGGKSYVIDAVGTMLNASAGAAINIGVAAQLNTTNPIANPAGALAIKSLSGKANYGGKGNAKASVTVTNDSAWHEIGTQLICANTANITLAVEFPVYGRYIVPPQGMFSLASLCNAAGTATAQPIIFWHEVQLTLG